MVRTRATTAPLWNFFVKHDTTQKNAFCKVCKNIFSYRSTITNLKFHLRVKHKKAYEELSRLERAKRLLLNAEPDVLVEKAIKELACSGDEDADEPQKLNDVWNYFEQEGSKVRCVVCRIVLLDSSYDSLKDHLFEQHPKLLLQLVQEQDSKSNDGSEDAADHTYTEVVYLEQEPPSAHTPRASGRHKITNTYSEKRPKKRTRINSSSDHPIIKLKKDVERTRDREERVEEDSELEVFIKYIRCLLKKLSPDVFSRVQVDILKTIMDAQRNSTVTEVKDTSTISAPSILTDIANGSVASVIRVSEIATDNGGLLGNYTVSVAPKGDNLAASTSTQD